MGKDVIVACDFSSAEATFAFLDKFTGRKPFGKWVITKKATSRKDGEKTRTCEVCEYVEKATIQATGSPAKTGDDSHIGMWAGILCVSLAGIIALVVLYKKKHKK